MRMQITTSQGEIPVRVDRAPEPGDVLVVQLPPEVSAGHVAEVAESLSRLFAGYRVILLSHDTRAEWMRRRLMRQAFNAGRASMHSCEALAGPAFDEFMRALDVARDKGIA